MKGLSSIERTVLECIGRNQLSYNDIQEQSGLHENVCFNVIQALVIRNLVSTDGRIYRISENLSPLMMEEVNGMETRSAESMELIEAVIEKDTERVFRLKKIAMDERDEKIFLAMLANLDSFLIDAHKKAQKQVPMKNRKVVFWGMGEVKGLMSQIVNGR